MYQTVDHEFERMVIDLEEFVSESNLVIGEEGISSAIAFVSENDCSLRFRLDEILPPVPLSGQMADKVLMGATKSVVRKLESSPVSGAAVSGIVIALFGDEIDTGEKVVLVEGHDRYGGARRVLIRLGESRRKTYTLKETVNDDEYCRWKDFWH